jgi:hypothetical protein
MAYESDPDSSAIPRIHVRWIFLAILLSIFFVFFDNLALFMLFFLVFFELGFFLGLPSLDFFSFLSSKNLTFLLASFLSLTLSFYVVDGVSDSAVVS